MRERDNRISQSIDSSLKNLRDIIDANAVIGKPVLFGDETIIPLSKITFFSLAGGGEYGKIGIFKKGEDLPFSAGNGAVVSMKPCAFLVKNGGEFKILSVAENSYEKLLDKTTEILSTLSGGKNE